MEAAHCCRCPSGPGQQCAQAVGVAYSQLCFLQQEFSSCGTFLLSEITDVGSRDFVILILKKALCLYGQIPLWTYTLSLIFLIEILVEMLEVTH